MQKPSISDYIIKETPKWIAVNKPAGLIVERSPFESITVESLLWNYLGKKVKKPYVGVIHRLDRVTSGVLLFAKKKQTLKAINAQFQHRKIRKVYLALLEKRPPQDRGDLKHYLVKDQQNKKAIIHDHEVANSQSCTLRYRFLKSTDQGFLVEVLPFTGRFHQIRAQMAAIGCPIVGDEKYGASTFFGGKAIGLHAWKLTFFDPQDQQPVLLESKADF